MRDLGTGNLQGPITPPAEAIAQAARTTLAEAAHNPVELDLMLRMRGLR